MYGWTDLTSLPTDKEQTILMFLIIIKRQYLILIFEGKVTIVVLHIGNNGRIYTYINISLLILSLYITKDSNKTFLSSIMIERKQLFSYYF